MTTGRSPGARRYLGLSRTTLRRRLVACYAAGIVVLWLHRELTWWLRHEKWRAQGVVPWEVRRSLAWPPPSAGSKRR